MKLEPQILQHAPPPIGDELAGVIVALALVALFVVAGVVGQALAERSPRLAPVVVVVLTAICIAVALAAAWLLDLF